MCEDAARTMHYALTFRAARGLPVPKPLPPEEIAKWWARYHSWYGQPCNK